MQITKPRTPANFHPRYSHDILVEKFRFRDAEPPHMTLLWTYKFHLALYFIIISSTTPFSPPWYLGS